IRRLVFLLATSSLFSFFFNDPPTTDIYTLSLHDALPISTSSSSGVGTLSSRPSFTSASNFPASIGTPSRRRSSARRCSSSPGRRSEEHTSELQSLTNLVCRLLLEKKKIC